MDLNTDVTFKSAEESFSDWIFSVLTGTKIWKKTDLNSSWLLHYFSQFPCTVFDLFSFKMRLLVEQWKGMVLFNK